MYRNLNLNYKHAKEIIHFLNEKTFYEEYNVYVLMV